MKPKPSMARVGASIPSTLTPDPAVKPEEIKEIPIGAETDAEKKEIPPITAEPEEKKEIPILSGSSAQKGLESQPHPELRFNIAKTERVEVRK